MAITKVTDLNSLYNLIYEGALFVAQESNLMVPLVRNFSATGFMQRKLSIRPQITAQSVSDGVDFSNPTTFGRTLQATLTPGEVMGQVILTDQDYETDPDDAVFDAQQELGMSIAVKIDTDLANDFTSFTTDKGTAGSSLTIARCAAGLAILRNSKIGGTLYFVLHPYGWHDIWVELGQPTTNQAFLGDRANQAMTDYWVNSMLGSQWFTNANITVDGSADAISGVFSPQALGFDERRAPRLEPERDASLRATELNITAGYAHGVLRATYGIKLTHDATEPV